MVRWPGRIPPGSTTDELVSLCDLMATCAEVLETDVPDEAAPDSFSMLPALREGNRETPIRESLIHHSLAGMFSVRQGPWKLCLGLGSGGFSEPKNLEPTPGGPDGQLYNLDEDPQETHNLWLEDPDRVKALTDLVNSSVKDGRTRR